MSIAATESETPRVSAALAATLESCGWLKREVHGPLVELARELERENDSLRAALRDADMAISAGQACRSEAEFTRWMHDSQRYRPHADLLTANGPDEGRREKHST